MLTCTYLHLHWTHMHLGGAIPSPMCQREKLRIISAFVGDGAAPVSVDEKRRPFSNRSSRLLLPDCSRPGSGHTHREEAAVCVHSAWFSAAYRLGADGLGCHRPRGAPVGSMMMLNQPM